MGYGSSCEFSVISQPHFGYPTLKVAEKILDNLIKKKNDFPFDSRGYTYSIMKMYGR